MLLQSLIAAAELTASVDTSDPHHATNESGLMHDADVEPGNEDSCDHCCQCHSHCSHLTLTTQQFSLAEYGADRVPSSLFIGALTRIPSSIDRPPIV
ncbi:hypothetical protein [Gilvimarinus sp. DA14]|uniref:hypothetical protein n=1 Tax=Gilvimarinus sp. DA14 TaxID=2956798 RepID=UPI0020B798C9|nr:hypothetical protein [Gilvimarinus sp. DA14]UTF60637.1 hypothetical protein NHM04_02230 [Gilvimarinus sp. DA14]